jgi:hypothetical protein
MSCLTMCLIMFVLGTTLGVFTMAALAASRDHLR